MELTRVGDVEDPLEGTNVTLICLIHTDGENKMRNGFPSPPEWFYRMNDTGEMQTINKTNPPEGLALLLFDKKSTFWTYFVYCIK